MRYLAAIIFSAVVFSCGSKETKEDGGRGDSVSSAQDTAKGEKFEMYEMSEMSMLMEQMYVDNKRLKERIAKGDTIGKFPNHFLKIHSAVMTDPKENDAFFKQKAEEFIRAQELIYKDPKHAETHFNEGVDACIQCHEVKCAGPIARIKKLYIKS